MTQREDSRTAVTRPSSPDGEVTWEVGPPRELLTRSGPAVSAQPHWWGFRIFLNHEAAEAVTEIRELVGEAVSLIAGLGEVLEAAIIAQGLWIKAVAGGQYGVVLNSPWVSPTMLIPTRWVEPQPDDEHLWWTVFDQEEGNWSPDTRFANDQACSSVPALVWHQTKLLCSHPGAGDDREALYETSFDHAADPHVEKWSRDRRADDVSTSTGVALSKHNGTLRMLQRVGSDGFGDMIVWTRDGEGWGSPVNLGIDFRTSAVPAMASWNFPLIAYRDVDGDRLWWSWLQGHGAWAPRREMGFGSADGPALAVLNDVPYCVFRGTGDDTRLYWSKLNIEPVEWTAPAPLGNHFSATSPALAVLNGTLYCVHRGSSDEKLWWTSFNGETWTPDQALPNHYSKATPALTAYRDPKHGTKDQLLCVHRGHGAG
ncbi:hypothetical protein A8924_7096 [Saccharopolyspora erythraea NRRL 2338]|nr:hypothetical protein N599_08375 [Saccharopolyspora erythraea D]PFG99547.1 hypothetical protein A8924_7096 [Saccharopolyspora erythraea NRRL 2338]